jgi:hypothetical protein
MSGPAPRRKEFEAEIRRLPDLSLDDLRARWKALFGHPAPLSLRRRFLARAVAYQMQVEAYGGLSASIQKRLQGIAAGMRQGNLDVAGIARTIGAQMLRQWKDQTHTVTALSDGFEWNGKTYKSLSAVARKITGTNWNGYVFFGIKRPAPGNKNAAGPRAKPLSPTEVTGGERDHG